MLYLLLCIGGLVAAIYALYYVKWVVDHKKFMEKACAKKEGFTTEYAVCKNKGFSKEYCVRRFTPGVGLTPDNVIGKVVSGSLGEVAVF